MRTLQIPILARHEAFQNAECVGHCCLKPSLLG